MNLLQKIKRQIVGPVRDLVGKLGIDLQKIQELDLQIRKLKSITDLETRMRAAEELVHKYPIHPKPHLELVQCYHSLNDFRQYEQMDCYVEVRREWLVRTGLAELDMEFIWPGMVTGSFGNHYAIGGLLRANQYGLRQAKKLFLLLPENAQLRNPALFSYFEPYLHVVRDGEVIQALKKLESLLTIPLGVFLPLNDSGLFLDIAANRVEMEREKQGLEPALFRLSDRHREMGAQALKQLGLPKDVWYVTLHVREPGYRGETRENTTENFRNVSPLDYLKAIKAITEAGGWVFRMGDPSMTPLPSMPHVIDYAHHEIRSDWMDVYLAATCRFLIATGSGYFSIPAFFNVPTILTNFPGFLPYYGMISQHLYLPRWLKNIHTDKLVSFEQYMSPPISNFCSIKHFFDAGLHWIENTPDELEAVTKEMLERTEDDLPSTINDDELQRRFKVLAEKCGLKYGSHSVKAFAPISRNFLEMHANLL